MLEGQGFKEIYNLSGGIWAWKGAVAEGPVGLNLDMVRGDEAPMEIIRLAYGMEQSLGGFYRVLKDRTQDRDVANLFDLLASMEEKHKERLLELGESFDLPDWNREQFEAEVSSNIMEGGFKSEEFMSKNEKHLRTVPDTLDVTMMLEAQALDLYLRFAERTAHDDTKSVLYKIGDEEKQHLKHLGQLREEKRG
jgi:sulfur-carrier protein adenylyltransferase/sulfurtransferase